MGTLVCSDFLCRRHKTDFSLRASDLGVESWYAEDLGDLKVVPLERLTGHLILAPITVRERDIWITVPYDHVSVKYFNCYYPY
jgi:hypothetical protein